MVVGLCTRQTKWDDQNQPADHITLAAGSIELDLDSWTRLFSRGHAAITSKKQRKSTGVFTSKISFVPTKPEKEPKKFQMGRGGVHASEGQREILREMGGADVV